MSMRRAMWRRIRLRISFVLTPRARSFANHARRERCRLAELSEKQHVMRFLVSFEPPSSRGARWSRVRCLPVVSRSPQ